MAAPEPAIANDEPRERAAIALAIALLRSGQALEVIVGGTSMWPLVREGERVRLDPAAAPRVGALAGVAREGRLIVHRIVRLRGGAVELRGDNLDRSDGTVASSEMLGVVTERWARSGRHVDHRHRSCRALDRAVAWTSARTRLPWRIASLLFAAHRRGR